MARNKYQMMRDSTVTDDDGNAYPDLATFSIEQFTTSTKPIECKLTYQNTQRFFDLIFSWYENFNFYDDITLWLNDIMYISDSDTNFQKTIRMYSKIDMDDFYLAGVKGESIEENKRITV